jgi:hypothetical protein
MSAIIIITVITSKGRRLGVGETVGGRVEVRNSLGQGGGGGGSDDSALGIL